MKYEIYLNGRNIKSSDHEIPIFDYLLSFPYVRIQSVKYKTDEKGNSQIIITAK